MPPLSIVVPTYNERDRLRELVKAIFAAYRSEGLDAELIIVDDNSPDGTGGLAEELARNHRIGVIHQGRMVRQLDTRDVAAQMRPRLSVTTRDHRAAETVLRSAGFAPTTNGDAGFVLVDDRAVHQPELVATLLVEARCPPTRLAR